VKNDETGCLIGQSFYLRKTLKRWMEPAKYLYTSISEQFRGDGNYVETVLRTFIHRYYFISANFS
jgi:uncharacterized protein HemX